MRGPRLAHAALLGLLTLVCAPGALAQAPAFAPELVLQAVLGTKAMLMVDGQAAVLAPGQTLKGVKLLSVGPDTVVVEVEGRRQEVGFGGSVSTRFAQPDRLETRVYRDALGMYQAVGSINGLPVRFLLDTGATFIGISADLARRAGVRYRQDGEQEMVQTAGGPRQVYRVELDSVAVGPINLRNVTAHVIEGEGIALPLLGMSFLGRLDIRNEGSAMVLEYSR